MAKKETIHSAVYRISDEVFGSRFVDENSDEFKEYEQKLIKFFEPQTTADKPELEEIIESFDKNFVIETIRQFGSQPQKVIYARKDKDIKDWLQEKFTQYGNQRAEAERQRIMKGVDKLYKDSKTGEILADSVLNIIQEPYAQQNK